MNITEDKLKAGIQIALGTLGLYTQEAETLLIHHIKALTLTDVVVPKGTLCDVCGSENTIGAPHMGSNCLDCNPL
jgi:tRNA(Ile2) C34 agmatinyltransferase TiaS